MVYAPTIVANSVLNRAFAEHRPVSPLKLHKVLFFIASEYHKQTG